VNARLRQTEGQADQLQRGAGFAHLHNPRIPLRAQKRRFTLRYESTAAFDDCRQRAGR
jgi:hypothetical protein